MGVTVNAEEPVTIYEAWNSLQAHLVCQVLAQADIEARVESDAVEMALGEVPFQRATSSVLVRAPDAERARAVMADFDARLAGSLERIPWNRRTLLLPLWRNRRARTIAMPPLRRRIRLDYVTLRRIIMRIALCFIGVLLALVVVAQLAAQDVTIETAPPVVVKTVPEAGVADVDPKTTEIKVTFSKDMQDGSWSWSTVSKESFPKLDGAPKYLPDKRTCVLPVKLEPGKTYGIWLNSQKFGNFKDADGRSAVPYLLVFRTSR